MLRISSISNAACAVDMNDKQVVQVTFDDGSFSGCVCLKCLGKMIEARAKKEQNGEKEPSAVSTDHSHFS